MIRVEDDTEFPPKVYYFHDEKEYEIREEIDPEKIKGENDERR